MTDVAVKTKARATMHLKVTRANGTVEEYDVPVATDLTKEQVLEMVRRHNETQLARCGAPATAAVNGEFLCEVHLEAVRAAASEIMGQLTVFAASGACMYPEES